MRKASHESLRKVGGAWVLFFVVLFRRRGCVPSTCTFSSTTTTTSGPSHHGVEQFALTARIFFGHTSTACNFFGPVRFGGDTRTH